MNPSLVAQLFRVELLERINNVAREQAHTFIAIVDAAADDRAQWCLVTVNYARQRYNRLKTFSLLYKSPTNQNNTCG